MKWLALNLSSFEDAVMIKDCFTMIIAEHCYSRAPPPSASSPPLPQSPPPSLPTPHLALGGAKRGSSLARHPTVSHLESKASVPVYTLSSKCRRLKESASEDLEIAVLPPSPPTLFEAK